MLNQKRIIVFFLLFTITYTGFSQFQNTISGGIAIATGDGSEEMKPGINISVEPVNRIINY